MCPVTCRSLSQRESNKGLISSIQITSVLERGMLIRLISILLCKIMTRLGKRTGTDRLWSFVLRSFKHCIETAYVAFTRPSSTCARNQDCNPEPWLVNKNWVQSFRNKLCLLTISSGFEYRRGDCYQRLVAGSSICAMLRNVCCSQDISELNLKPSVIMWSRNDFKLA